MDRLRNLTHKREYRHDHQCHQLCLPLRVVKTARCTVPPCNQYLSHGRQVHETPLLSLTFAILLLITLFCTYSLLHLYISHTSDYIIIGWTVLTNAGFCLYMAMPNDGHLDRTNCRSTTEEAVENLTYIRALHYRNYRLSPIAERLMRTKTIRKRDRWKVMSFLRLCLTAFLYFCWRKWSA